MQEIQLRDYQTIHYNRLNDILQKSMVAIDTSSMRLGKSFVAHKLNQEFGFTKAIVICPATVESVWRNMGSVYGPKYYEIISYESWRSVTGSQPKHGLIHRTDDNKFEVTDNFRSLLDEGLLLICDEFHKIKNKTDQFYAVKAAINAMTSTGGANRILLLSGTPIDQEEQAVNLLELTGIISSSVLFKFHSKEERLELVGAKELKSYCLDIDVEKTNNILKTNPFNTKNIPHICYLLYLNIIHPRISSAMSQQEDYKVALDVKNLHVILSPDEEEIYNTCVDNLAKTTKFAQKKVDLKNINWPNITTYMKNIETVLNNPYVRVARRDLETIPNCKVILSFNFTDSINYVANCLSEYNPLILNGSIHKDDREMIIKKFQEPTLEHRLIITNLKVISLGICLEDKIGYFPRRAYGSPNFSAIDMLQWVNRFHSKETKGSEPVYVRFIYGKSNQPLKSIINSIIRKNKVFKDILKTQVENGLLFQDDYLNENELEI